MYTVQVINFVNINFIKCFSKVKFLSVGFSKSQTQLKNIIKNPNIKIKHLELLYFVFKISVVFFKSLFQSFLTLRKYTTLRNLTLGKHFMKLIFRK